MDDLKQQFKQYFGFGNMMLWIGLFFILIGASLVIVPKFLQNKPADAVVFDAVDVSQENQYTYIDVVGIDDWSASRGDEYYYIVADTQEKLNLVKMDSAIYEAMTAQQNYWKEKNSGKEIEMPQPYRIYGISHGLEDAVVSVVAETYGETSESMKAYIGNLYLAEGTGSDDDSLFVPFMISAIVAGIIGISLIISNFLQKKRIEKTIAELEASGKLAEVWGEIQSAQSSMKQGYLFTENYLVSKQAGRIVSYNDILWTYKQVIKRYFITVNSYVICGLSDGSMINIMPVGFSKKDKIEEIFQIIAVKNPSVMIGYTSENGRAFKEMTKK